MFIYILQSDNKLSLKESCKGGLNPHPTGLERIASFNSPFAVMPTASLVQGSGC